MIASNNLICLIQFMSNLFMVQQSGFAFLLLININKDKLATILINL